MTKFADAKFSVASPLTPEYEEGYARTFSATIDEGRCTECYGTGRTPDSGHRVQCDACKGTGRRAWQTS